MNETLKYWLIAAAILVLGLLVSWFAFGPALGIAPSVQKNFPVQLGLDLQGGTHLVYQADISNLPPREVEESMSALRDVIERRVNTFGVSQPLVQTSGGGLVAGSEGERRLIVELPGVTDVDRATEIIGKTPVLEFKVLPGTATSTVSRATSSATTAPATSSQATNTSTTASAQNSIDPATTSSATSSTSAASNSREARFIRTELTGRFLQDATLRFSRTTNQPIVALQFNDRGTELFATITEQNVGNPVAIFLDGSPISTPTVNEPITAGQATISGNFTPEEARTLVGRLNSGALPIPIELLSSQSIGATLGQEAYRAGVLAGFVGLILVAAALILWYRLPGVLAVVALSIYVSIMIALFKLIPVTITAAGIAGLVLSLGFAVDANILIFERMKEEIRRGNSLRESVAEGFRRAWPSIRDGNATSIISAIILFWFGTSLVQGFALVFGLGVIISMLSAITITRTFLFALAGESDAGGTPNSRTQTLWNSGLPRLKRSISREQEN